ncbi:hypothetical protein ABT294_17615 [Nonomuraea sp. NPDC000554]|uniref:hypothetical protein n=1 Tax=Nonomuraea sp. NPDC000554 TaxID=3154259 RepID=UPI00332A08C5
MPLDDALTARMAEPDFWAAYLFEDDADEDEEPLRAEFGLGGELALVLDLDITDGLVELALTAPGLAEPAELGWDDQAHFHPHVMRWAELDLLARALALHDPQMRHPGPALALLARFVVLDEQDDLDTVTPLLDAAFRMLRPGPRDGVRPETRDWFELRDLRGTGLRWTAGPDGHPAVEQTHTGAVARPLYSLRTPDSADFPFAAWAALLDRARQILATATADPSLDDPAVRAALRRCTATRGYAHLAPLAEALRAAGGAQPVLLRALDEPVSRAESCWAVEVLAGLPQGALVKRWFGLSPLSTARSWELSLTLAIEGRAAEHSRVLTSDLAGALKEAGLGGAEIAGGSSRRAADGTSVDVSTAVDVLVRDDLARGVSLISEILRRHDAAATAELRHTSPPYDLIAPL